MAPTLRTKKLPATIDKQSVLNQQLTTKKKVKCKNKLNTEVQKRRLERKRNAEKLRRQKIRHDPEAYEKYCQKERARNEKRKKEGKLKLIHQLSDREKRARRKQQNLWKKNSRARQKGIIELEKPEDVDIINLESKQAKLGKKRVQKNLRKCFRDNKKLSNDNKTLRMRLNSLNKKLQRLKIKKTDTTSPRSKVNKLLEGTKVDLEIRKKLIFHEVMVQQLQSSYRDTKSLKFKQILGRVISGKIVKKYRQLSAVKKNVAPVVSSRVHRSNNPLEYVKSKKRNQIFIQEQVKHFYEENSTVIPDKKACIKINGTQITKRYMNASIKDLHAKFCSQSTYRTSYSTFANLRPRHCIEPKITNRNTCACFTHENFSLLIHAFHSHKLLTENTTHKILSIFLCDSNSELCLSRTCENCKLKKVEFNLEDSNFNDKMFYMKWDVSSEQRVNEKTKKPMTVKITTKKKFPCTVGQAINHFNHELNLFIAHEYRITHQNNSMKKLTQSLTSNELVLLIDFSENYSCKYATEVQSVHFGASRVQCTLHTGMIYSSNLTQGFATLSKSLRHDPSAIIIHMKKILDVYLLTNPEIKILHIMSDGPTTQYRNKKMFYLITQYLPQCYTQLQDITYNFSEAGHGKSSADGIGGYIKKLADDQVKYGTDLSNFDSLLAILRDRVKSVYIDCVTDEEISNIDEMLPENFKPFVGTMKVHQYTWNKLQHNQILFNSLSCFDCLNENVCRHFFMGKIDYSTNNKAGKINNELTQRTKQSVDSSKEVEKSPQPSETLKYLQKEIASNNSTKIRTELLRRSSRIKKVL